MLTGREIQSNFEIPRPSSSSLIQSLPPSPQPPPPPPPSMKRRKTKNNNQTPPNIGAFEALVNALEKGDEPVVKDGDEHFCASLVPQLKRLTIRDNQLARIKIQQLLFDIEFGTE